MGASKDIHGNDLRAEQRSYEKEVRQRKGDLSKCLGKIKEYDASGVIRGVDLAIDVEKRTKEIREESSGAVSRYLNSVDDAVRIAETRRDYEAAIVYLEEARTSTENFHWPYLDSPTSSRVNDISSEIRRLRDKSKPEWMKDMTFIFIIFSILIGIFFLSFKITGNSIGGLADSTSNFVGGILFSIGLVAGFFWMKRRK